MNLSVTKPLLLFIGRLARAGAAEACAAANGLAPEVVRRPGGG
jgi:hypothetical protein